MITLVDIFFLHHFNFRLNVLFAVDILVDLRLFKRAYMVLSLFGPGSLLLMIL